MDHNHIINQIKNAQLNLLKEASNNKNVFDQIDVFKMASAMANINGMNEALKVASAMAHSKNIQESVKMASAMANINGMNEAVKVANAMAHSKNIQEAVKMVNAMANSNGMNEAVKGKQNSKKAKDQLDLSEDLIAKQESDLRYIQRIKMEFDSAQKQLHFYLNDIEGSKNDLDKKIFNTEEHLTASTEELEEKKTNLEQEISNFKAYIKDETTKLKTKIAEINRIALAAEFIKRRKKLEFRRILYFLGFICGLGTIILLGLFFLASFNNPQGIIAIIDKWILPLKETPPDAQGIWQIIAQLILLFLNNTPPNTQGMMPILTQVVSKLFLMGPVVWLTWFFAKQYANTNRLAEDYVFKATTALAYKGYEEKAKEHKDVEMEKELLRTAIRTFGDNPTRLLSKNECASPLNEALQLLEVVGKVQNKTNNHG